jgi:hypothetical protein
MFNRKYLIIPSTEVKKINFDEIMETAHTTLVYSGDGKRTFIKWVGDDPSFVSGIKNAEGPYTHSEILSIIRSEDWISPVKKKTSKKVT